MSTDDPIKLIPVSTSLPEDLHQAIVAEAEAGDRSVAAQLRRIIREHVDRVRRPLAYQDPWQPATPGTTNVYTAPHDSNVYTAPHDSNVQVRWEQDPALTTPNNDEGLA